MVEFGIAHKPLRSAAEWHVMGRCVTDICVGARFTSFIPYHRVENERDVESQYKRGVPLSVDLTVMEIQSYGRIWAILSAGMTGKLVLRGEGTNLGTFGSLCE
jgi:hypothetical protein